VSENQSYWHPPRMWPDGHVVIIGGGDSLKGFDWEWLLRRKHEIGFRVVGVNDAYVLGAHLVDVLFFGDMDWWYTHRKIGLYDFGGLMVHSATEVKHMKYVKCMHRNHTGLPEGSGNLGWNSNSGFAAIHLALLFGATSLVLLGFDMKLGDGGNANWHLNLNDNPNPEIYPRFLLYWERYLWPDLQTKYPDVELVNANPKSRLPDLLKTTPEEALLRWENNKTQSLLPV